MNEKSLLLLLTIVLLCITTITTHAQEASDEKIAELLEVTKTKDQFIVGMQTMADLQKDSPQTAMLPEGFYDELIKEANSRFEVEFLPKIADIYKQNLTANEIEQLISFYKTDLGKMVLTKLPPVQAKIANAGMTWGQQLGMEVAEQLMSKE